MTISIKSTRKLLSVLLAIAVIASMFAFTVFAADTGTITIKKTSNVSVDGKTFRAYKILDATLGSNGQIAYIVPDSMVDFYEDYFELQLVDGHKTKFDRAVNKAIAEIPASERDAFAKAVLEAAKKANIAPAEAVGAGDEVKFTGLPFGYYVIEDTTSPEANDAVSAVMIDSTNPDAEINLKAAIPTLEKVIVNEAGETQIDNSAIGDDVNFKLTSKVPDMTGYNRYYFVINDTMSAGLDFNNDVKVSIGGAELAASAYEVTEKDGNIRIIFKDFLQYKADMGKDIVVTYSATVTTAASIGTANKNEATITFSNNPSYDYEGNTGTNPDDPQDDPNAPTGETPKSSTETYTTSLTIKKVDGDGNALKGAEFTLTGTALNTVIITRDEFVEDANGTYYLLADGTYSTTAPENYEGALYKKHTVSDTVVKEEQVEYKAFVGDDGLVTFTGLSAGNYTVKESVVPDGYNGIDPIAINITFNNGAFDVDGDAEVANNLISLTVENNTGSLLPETGGIGTYIFYGVGFALMAAAVVLYIYKRKANKTA